MIVKACGHAAILHPPIRRNPIRFAFSPQSLAAATLCRRHPLPSISDICVKRFGISNTKIRASVGENPSSFADNDGEEEEAEAREAVVEMLMEYGATREDAVDIAWNCPKYVELLVGNVRELDEHSLWSSWRSKGEMGNGRGGGEEEGDEVEDAGLSFKRKVYCMAKERGDKGILPFLERMGLSRSSSLHIAGYLSSEKLPDLISKVKYVKEIVFSGNGHEMLIGRNARRMMMHLSIPIDEDIQQTLSFFEKMEARRGGLEMLGFTDASFPFLIESFPRLLLCPVESRLKPLFEFLEKVGVPKRNFKDILLLFPPIIFYDNEKDIKPKIHALRKAGVEDREVGRVLLKYPWVLSTSIQENYEEIHSFFEVEKVLKSSVDQAIKSWPHLLGCSTGKLKLMVKQFGELGVTNKMLATIISSSPQLLLRKPNEFLEVVSFMEEIGLDEDTIRRILCRCPEIFASNIEKTLRKKIDLLTDFGISGKHLPRVIKKYPELLVSDVNNTLLPRMKFLMEIGLSKRDVSSMIHRFSPLLGYSTEVVLKPKLEFLLKTMEKPLKEVVEYPRYFSYSMEKKIKPRFYVLKGRNIQCSLKEMLGKNDEEFAEEYMGIGRMLVLPASPSSGISLVEGKSLN